MAGIILEMYRIKSTSEVHSEFWLLPAPFAPALQPLTKAEARDYIRSHQLHVAVKDKSGRIWDTASQRFQHDHAASEKFLKPEKKRESKQEARARKNQMVSYKLALMYHLDYICDELDQESDDYNLEAVANALWDQLGRHADWERYDKVDDYVWESNVRLDVDGFSFSGWGQEVGDDKEIMELNCTLPDGREIKIF